MSSVNKVIIIGNLGKDPEINHMPNGGTVANVTIATSESWKDKNTGEKQERTEWHRVVFFRKLAEIVEKWVKKGSKIYIEGKLQTRKWTDSEGKDRYTTEVVADQMRMLGGKTEPNIQPPSQQPPQQQTPQQMPDDGFEDIPF